MSTQNNHLEWAIGGWVIASVFFFSNFALAWKLLTVPATDEKESLPAISIDFIGSDVDCVPPWVYIENNVLVLSFDNSAVKDPCQRVRMVFPDGYESKLSVSNGSYLDLSLNPFYERSILVTLGN